MSPDELSELAQLDRLASELAEAGRRARVASAAAPDPDFADRLRAKLVKSADSAESRDHHRHAGIAPLPPSRPEGFVERRREGRPFMNPRTVWDAPPMAAPVRRASDVPSRELVQPMFVRPEAAATDRSVDDRAQTHEPEVAPPAPRAEPGPVVQVRPSIRWRIPTRLMPAKWVGLGLAACLVLGLFLAQSQLLQTAHVSARVVEAVSTNLVRGGTTSALAVGTELREGDEIRVGSGGHATLTLGSSMARMDSGADMTIDTLGSTDEVVSQLAGRVYHRVSVPAGGSYAVITASVEWIAHGTAFDLDRYSSGGYGYVLGLALQHDLQLTAPQYGRDLPEGDSALFTLSGSGAVSGSPSLGSIGSDDLASAWLVQNAQLDAGLGLPLGLLANCVNPTPEPTRPPVTEEPATPAPSPEASVAAPPTPAPTAPPAPPAPPTVGNSLGTLRVTAKPGGKYSFGWSQYTGSGFEYYKLVYCAGTCAPAYDAPGTTLLAAISPATQTSWLGTVPAGEWSFRVQAVRLSGGTRILASSSVYHLVVAPPATLPPTVELGSLDWVDNNDGTYTFSWSPYTGPGPWNYYKLVFGPSTGPDPSYPGGSSYWAVPNTGDTSVILTVGVNGFQPGTWKARIQAIGYPNGAYAYAETSVAVVAVVAPTPSASVCPLVVTPTPTPCAVPSPT